MNALRDWMSRATPEQQKRLAKLAGTSRPYLYAMANPTSSYGRAVSPDMARRLEAAAVEIMRDDPRMPPLHQHELSPTCRACPYYRESSSCRSQLD